MGCGPGCAQRRQAHVAVRGSVLLLCFEDKGHSLSEGGTVSMVLQMVFYMPELAQGPDVNVQSRHPTGALMA